MLNLEQVMAYIRWFFLGENVEQPKPIRIEVEREVDQRSRNRRRR